MKRGSDGFLCLCCGQKIVWGSSGRSCDLFGNDDPSAAWYYRCPCCGTSYEILECPGQDKPDFEFWNDDEQ